MAAKAREILEWCRYGLQKMESDPTGFDWVMIWAGTIALLRAIGHALDKEDTKCPSEDFASPLNPLAERA
jgi:hypothetical protein